jgi:hypothetical protein
LQSFFFQAVNGSTKGKILHVSNLFQDGVDIGFDVEDDVNRVAIVWIDRLPYKFYVASVKGIRNTYRYWHDGTMMNDGFAIFVRWTKRKKSSCDVSNDADRSSRRGEENIILPPAIVFCTTASLVFYRLLSVCTCSFSNGQKGIIVDKKSERTVTKNILSLFGKKD